MCQFAFRSVKGFLCDEGAGSLDGFLPETERSAFSLAFSCCCGRKEMLFIMTAAFIIADSK